MLDVTRKALETLLYFQRQQKEGGNPIGLYDKAIALAQEAIDAEEEEMMYVPPVASISNLTKRERIAAMMFQGFASNPQTNCTMERLAAIAVDHAAALIAELQKTSGAVNE